MATNRSIRALASGALAFAGVAVLAAPVHGQAGPEEMQLELGLGAGVFIADDEHEFYDPLAGAQEPISTFSPDVLGRLGIYPLRFLGVEGEGSSVFTGRDSGGSARLLSLRGSVVAQLPARVTPFLLGGVGTTWTRSSMDALGDDRDRVWHAGAGLKFFLTSRAHLRLDGRWYYSNRLRDGLDDNGMISHFGVTLGAGFNLGLAPRETAKRVEVAEVIEPVDPGPQDSDGDGVLDDEDECPHEPGPVENRGCPDTDRDGDGVVDRLDGCPDEPGPPENQGCPDTDRDGDGVVDRLDGCPDEPGPPDNQGCPHPDRDGDGVPDHLDNCPDEPGPPDNQGCPDKQAVVITQTQLRILDTVTFGTANARIRPRSRRLLNQVANVLINQPRIKKVRIEGHTDNRGPEGFNQRLSEQRAEAVRDYLVGRGVDASRLETIGHGLASPIEDNGTARGRAANRRVEFHIVDPAPTGGPTD